jgi:hypothetical protein
MAILIYQVVLAGIILFSALQGRKALYKSATVLSMWTLTHLFMPWLVGLQFATIVIAFFIGLGISNPKKSLNSNS